MTGEICGHKIGSANCGCGWHPSCVDASPPGETKDEIDAQTGGLHPTELCGEDCSGCCDEWEWK